MLCIINALPTGSCISCQPASYIASVTICGPEGLSFINELFHYFPCMQTTSWIHLTIIKVPLHLCFWSVGVMLTGDVASCPSLIWNTCLIGSVPQGMLVGRKSSPKQTKNKSHFGVIERTYLSEYTTYLLSAVLIVYFSTLVKSMRSEIELIW